MKIKNISLIITASIVIFTSIHSDFFQDLYDKADVLFTDGKRAIVNLKNEFDKIIAQITDPIILNYIKQTDIAHEVEKVTEVATIRFHNSLPEAEIDAVKNRREINKMAQEKLLGISLEKPLTIGVSFSGGGDRALVAALGSLCGLDEIKLLDGVTYLALLSGSTWMAPWFAHGNKIRQYKNMAAENLTTGLEVRNFAEAKGIFDRLLLVAFQKKPLTTMSIYDALLVNTFFRDFGRERFTKHMVAQFENIKTGKMPFAINTAIILDPAFPGEEWMEFNGVEIGSEFLGAFAPTWSFNRNFKAGRSTDFAFDFPFYLGTYGGAIGLNVDLLYRHSIEKELSKLPVPLDVFAKNFFREILEQKLTSRIMVKNVSFPPLMSVFRNFTFGVKEGILKTEETMELTDAGLAFNNPIPPLLRYDRQVDVIMIFDNSAGEGIFQGEELRKIVEYVKRKNKPFPEITEQEIQAAGKRTITVFQGEDPNVPVVMYFPRFKDEGQWNWLKTKEEFQQFVPILEGFSTNDCLKTYCNTFNFKYQKHETEQLSAFTEFNVLANKEAIIETLKWAAKQRNIVTQ